MYDYVKEHELACPCCKVAFVNRAFLLRLNDARHLARVPFVITSGYRCEKHNKDVGGSLTSAHRLGLAVDIACPDSHTRYRIIIGLIGAGFKRIGIGKNFIHVDAADCEIKADEVIWHYYEEKK